MMNADKIVKLSLASLGYLGTDDFILKEQARN